MQDARLGRVGDVPDGGRDRHDGRARLCAAELTERPLRTRVIILFASQICRWCDIMDLGHDVPVMCDIIPSV